jgi:hypothetical protein
MKKYIVIALTISTVFLGVFIYTSKNVIPEIAPASSRNLGLTSKSLGSTPENGETFEVKVVTKEQQTDFATLNLEIDQELESLGSHGDIAEKRAKEEFLQYCPEIAEIDEKIKELALVRDEKLASIGSSKGKGKEIAKVIFDHLVEIQFLALVRFECKTQKDA